MNEERTSHVALITGAAQGFGKAMALGLAAKGMSIAAVDRDLPGLERLKAEIATGSDPDRFEFFLADLSSVDATNLASQVVARFSRIDILINNAGIGQGQVRSDYHRNPPRFYEVTPEQWSRAIAVNANALFLLSRAVVEPMIRRKWGRIINITTSLGTMIRGGYSPYGPSKAAAEALSAVMAADLAGTGVTVNVLIPGGLANTGMIPPDAPFSREDLIQPEAMLPPIYWLVSPESDATTGRRFLATKWDNALEPAIAAEKAGAPIGWKDIAALPVTPQFRSSVSAGLG